MRCPRLPRLALAIALAAFGCGAPESRAPCLADESQVITFPFHRLEQVSHEAEGDTELARFAFDPAAPGEVTVTVEPAVAPFVEFSTGEGIGVQGHRLWSVRIEGLLGGAATDRVRSDISERYRIREVVQVVDEDAFRWVVGTAAGSCVRLGNDQSAALLVLHVAAE